MVIPVIYFSTVIVYFITICLGVSNWKFWESGFKEQDGTFTSKYYQIAFHLMRTGFVLFIGTVGYAVYWTGVYVHIL